MRDNQRMKLRGCHPGFPGCNVLADGHGRCTSCSATYVIQVNMRFIQSIIGGLLALALSSSRVHDCPLCGGVLTKVGDVTDDKSIPSKNIAVWNRSICGNHIYRQDSVICSKCWHAKSVFIHYWERRSILPDSFRRPLAEDIRRFPLPAEIEINSLVVYSQKCTAKQVIESVAFWCTKSPDIIASFRDYAQQHDLELRVEGKGDFPNEVWVAVEAKPKAR